MLNLRFLLVTLFIAAVSLIGCSKPPTEEMNNAIAAVSRAENDPDVVKYAAPSLARAREALAQMQAEADAKRYDAAKRLAADAQTLAEKAVNDGRAAVARAREESENAIRLMQNSLSETEQVLSDASRTRPAGVNLPQLEQDFEDARGIAGQAVAAQSGNRYSEAVDKSQTVRAALSSITSRLSQSVISVSRKK
jgi:hypothetical protein